MSVDHNIQNVDSCTLHTDSQINKREFIVLSYTYCLCQNVSKWSIRPQAKCFAFAQSTVQNCSVIGGIRNCKYYKLICI